MDWEVMERVVQERLELQQQRKRELLHSQRSLLRIVATLEGSDRGHLSRNTRNQLALVQEELVQYKNIHI